MPISIVDYADIIIHYVKIFCDENRDFERAMGHRR